MPNKPKTPLRAVRIDDGLWHDAKEATAHQGTTVSAVIRDSLRRYVNKHRKTKEK